MRLSLLLAFAMLLFGSGVFVSTQLLNDENLPSATTEEPYYPPDDKDAPEPEPEPDAKPYTDEEIQAMLQKCH